MSKDQPILLSIREFSLKHKFMSDPALRWLVYKNPPGLDKCIIRPSVRRLYIDEKKFFEFLRKNTAINREGARKIGRRKNASS